MEARMTLTGQLNMRLPVTDLEMLAAVQAATGESKPALLRRLVRGELERLGLAEKLVENSSKTRPKTS